jgi:hypothetical protein
MASEEPTMSSVPLSYPVVVEVDPPAPQNRWSVLFRLVLAVPHLLILNQGMQNVQALMAVVAWFAILFTGRYPASLFRFAVGIERWTIRVGGYCGLLAGAYPPFGIEESDGYSVRYSVVPALENRNRLTTFFRLFMAIPHLVVLLFLWLAALVVLVIAWFAALFTGTVPLGLHSFLEGVLRWTARAAAYVMLLTDVYPPFSLT